MTLRSILFIAFVSAITTLTHGSRANAHGTPIHVEVVGGKLVVSGGWPDATGFAPMIFGEDDEDGDTFASLDLPQTGPVTVWQLPGLELVGMEPASSLSIEILPRTVVDGDTSIERQVWWWNPQPMTVETSPSNFYLLGTGMRSLRIEPTADDPPPPFMLAQSVAGQQGFHNHGLVSYAIQNGPAAPEGVFGFFARLTASLHAPSDPFLLVFNHEVDEYELVMPAALAINAAALNAEPIEGDYDGNGTVNTADYELWRARFGQSVAAHSPPDGNGNGTVDAADYIVWRNGFGQTAVGALPSATVPEPSGIALGCAVLLISAFIRRRRGTKSIDTTSETT